jgi:hypothetical protein
MTCATQKNVEAIDQIDNLFLVAPNTELHDFLNEIDDFKKLMIDSTSVKANSRN